MKYFNVPADFKKETIDQYVRLNNTYKDSKVIETYGNVTLGTNFGSGRVLSQLPKIDLLDLREYVEYSKQNHIVFSFTLNAPYMQNREFTKEGVLKMKEFLKDLHEAGVESIIIALPSLIDLVKFSGYDFKIKASTICHITNAHKARAYKRIGVDKIVVDESVHRDFAALKRIRNAFGDRIEIIVNTMCHRNCLYRHFHYNETGGDSSGHANEIGVNYFEHKCLLQRYADASEILKLAWIRPEDLKYYTAVGINYFKLQGRQHTGKTGHIKTLEYYFKEDYDGNLMDLLDMFNPRYSFRVYLDNKKLDGFLKPYYEIENFCKNDCDNCNYCRSFAGKCISIRESEEIIQAAKEFYNEYDQFKKLVDSVNVEGEKEVKQLFRENVDFNLE